jgi:hypothetical protein
MGPVHDSRHDGCVHAASTPDGLPSCLHPTRALLYPATGCEMCPVMLRRRPLQISGRGTTRPLKFRNE